MERSIIAIKREINREADSKGRIKEKGPVQVAKIATQCPWV